MGDSMNVCFDGTPVILCYSNEAILFNKDVLVPVSGSWAGWMRTKRLNQAKYDKIEQTAQLYLIRNAIRRKENGKNLVGIIGIMQDVECDWGKQGIELGITLTGLAVYS
jgi:hypothetical protein